MKRLIKYLYICLLLITIQVKAQTIQIPQGKTFNLTPSKDEGTLTTNKAIYKDITYPVYVTNKGKLFIKLVSVKTNKPYRKYIKQ